MIVKSALYKSASGFADVASEVIVFWYFPKRLQTGEAFPKNGDM